MHPDDPATPPAPSGTEPAWTIPSTDAAPATPETPPVTPLVEPVVRASGTGPRRTTVATVLAAILVAVLGGGALFLSGYSLGRHEATTPGTPPSEAELFQPFWDAYRAVTERYAGGSVDKQTLVEGAIRGLIDAVGDPYSTYLSADDYRKTLDDISGRFQGIGAEIGTVDANRQTANCSPLGPDCRLVIIAPIDGSPAQKAGLKPGDIIDKVDGSGLDGLTVAEAGAKIRGDKGTVVTLTIDREGQAPFDVPVTRDVIVQRELVTKSLADGTVGYLRITGFSDTAAADFVDALKQDIAAGQKLFVVDLRGNPGGFVTAARTVASAFIGSGPIFWQEDAQGKQTPTDALPDGVATDPSIKVVVLIDRGSASASEIVAGALQDTGRATLVGETSFGKGTVQQWTDLGAAGGFKLTIAKWLTPDKRWIHKVGLTPDVPVTVPADTPAGSDPVLDKALEILAKEAPTASALRHAA
jgi:carboxyl-terminal processing protease